MAFLILLSLFWANVGSYYFCFTEGSAITFELCDPFDSEPEESEQKNEENKDDEIRTFPVAVQLLHSKLSINTFHSLAISSLHQPEILTPPPEQLPAYC